jgi:prepilin-type N-terminal cleavage/methylation domain-containing protein
VLKKREQSTMRKIKGFTLIELLVVIAIIALLLAILVPTLQRVRKQTRAFVCQANLKQWGTTLALYTEDNQGRLPSNQIGAIWLLRGSAPSEDVTSKPDQYNSVRTEGIACCPVAVKPVEGFDGFVIEHGPISAPQWKIRVKMGRKLRAWEITEPGPPFLCSYGFNAWLLDSLCSYSLNKFPGRYQRDQRGLDVLSLSKRGETPALLDSAIPFGQPFPDDCPPLSETNYDNHFKCFCINRHNGFINSVFLDWSVRKIGLKELWKLKWYPEFDTAGPWTRAGGVKPEDWPEWMRNFKDY